MDIPGLPARKAALRLLDAVLRRGETLEAAGPSALQGIRSDADRALARALAGEALRWLTDLDGLIDSATKQRLPDDAKARGALRLMLAGWLRLETPGHAVIATALPLLAGGPRRLAHGVFSTLARQAASLPATPTLPGAVAARWGERAEAVAAALALPPPLDLTLRDPAETARWCEQLGGISLLPGHVRLPRGEAIERLAGFKDGAWWVQDLAASLPARLLGVEPGMRVLDLCAAPGGKTLQLAAAGATVTALDISDTRLDRLRANLARTGLAAEVVAVDALAWRPDAPFAAVLLDAPCSASGVFRRHPDVLYKGDRDLRPLLALQAELIDRAVDALAPGGRLVIATCSLERAEGEDQLAAALRRHPALALDCVGVAELPAGFTATGGVVRVLPGTLAAAGGVDGFFIARLRRA